MSFAELFKSQLDCMMWEAARAGLESFEITAADLLERLAIRPRTGEDLTPVCSQVMRAAVVPGDAILEDPPAGHERSLRIKYALPRPAWR